MIHHVSIPARDPRRVAEVLAELMGGQCHPFGPLDGAYMAASGDRHGSMIEVYPERATLDIPPNDDQVVFGENAAPPRNWPLHPASEGFRRTRGLARENLRTRDEGAGPVLSRRRILAREPSD